MYNMPRSGPDGPGCGKGRPSGRLREFRCIWPKLGTICPGPPTAPAGSTWAATSLISWWSVPQDQRRSSLTGASPFEPHLECGGGRSWHPTGCQ